MSAGSGLGRCIEVQLTDQRRGRCGVPPPRTCTAAGWIHNAEKPSLCESTRSPRRKHREFAGRHRLASIHITTNSSARTAMFAACLAGSFPFLETPPQSQFPRIDRKATCADRFHPQVASMSPPPLFGPHGTCPTCRVCALQDVSQRTDGVVWRSARVVLLREQ